MIVDLQLLCCALPSRGQSWELGRELGGCLHRRHQGARAPAAPSPGLAHVDGVEDPLRELLQLVGGILGLLLQPQVVLSQVLNLRLKVSFVFFFLGGRAGQARTKRVASPCPAARSGCGSVCALHLLPSFIALNSCLRGLVLGLKMLSPRERDFQRHPLQVDFGM